MGVIEEIREEFGEYVEKVEEFRGERTIYILRGKIHDVMVFLKEKGYNRLVDITAVDYPEREERFEIVYHLNSMSENRRIRVKTRVDEREPFVPSITDIFPGANWLEREVYDMFGIIFENHPNLKRILLWDDFPGHPLRKDFPLREDVPLPEAD